MSLHGRERRARAFTLIELLVVTAILGLVVGVIGASLAAGMRAWDAARTFQTAETDAIVALRILRRDFMNAFPFYGIPFEGSAQGFTCATLLHPAPGARETEPRVGAVHYSFDSSGRLLRRSRWPFPGEERDDAAPESLARSVEAMTVEYAAGDGGGWLDSWHDATNNPAAIRVRLAVKGRDLPVELNETVVAALQAAPRSN